MAHTRQFDTRGKHADHPGAAGTAEAAAGRVPADNPAAWSTPLHEYDYRGNPPGGVTLRAAVTRGGAPAAVTVIPCDVTPCPGLNPDGGRAWLAVPRGYAPVGAELRYVYLAPGDVLILPGDPRLAGAALAPQQQLPPVPEVPVEPDDDDRTIDEIADQLVTDRLAELRTPPVPAVLAVPAEPAADSAPLPADPGDPAAVDEVDEVKPDPGPPDAVQPDPAPADEVTADPAPVLGKVHRACGYRIGSPGHKLICEDA
jgi:hypothetical protein